ncbi:MAG TPA: TldD/PmbA family protein [Candidatus Saccharimonadales bacterium]|nr:TldD/PmbA family protein [Candidatus Saccharimonadales bacterium]
MSDAAVLADRAASILGELGLTAEIYLEDSTASSITVASGQVESFEMKEELGAGIRIFDGGRVGFAYTADLSPEGVQAAASAARLLAEHTDADPASVLPDPRAPGEADAASGDTTVARVETYRKIALAKAMEDAARGADPRVVRVREARYGDLLGRIEVRNTKGFSRGGSLARIYGSIDVIAEEKGASQAGHASDFALKIAALDPFKIGREAAHRAVGKLGALRPATTRSDVLFDPAATADLLQAFAPALFADQVLKGKSFLAGEAGRKVAAPCVSLVDDGRFPSADGSFPFDGEGVSTRRTVLIEEGVLRGYLHSAWTAAKMGVEPTGNSARVSYTSLPRVGPTTIYMVPSARPAEEILGGVQEGFRITELMGLHTVDPITGEFSLGASGRRIRNGRLEEPVAGLGLAGSVARFLKDVAGVGSDLRLFPGSSAGSTILVRGLSVSGS